MTGALVLALALAGAPEGEPVVRLLTHEASPWGSERALEEAIALELPGYRVELVQGPDGFPSARIPELAKMHAAFFEARPGGALVWLDATGRPTVYVLTAGQGQPELRAIDTDDWAETRSQVVAWLAELLERLRLADAPAPRPAWRASAGGGPVLAAVDGGALDGFVLLRAFLARRGPGATWWGIGIEGFPATLGRAGGWGLGPGARLELAPVRLLQLGLGVSLIGHRLPAAAGFADEGWRWSLRTAGRVGLDLEGPEWVLGLAGEVGFWPLRTRLDVGGVEDVGTPRLDVGIVLEVGRLL